MTDFPVSFHNESGRSVNQSELVATARFAMASLRLHPRTELNIRCVGLAKMEELHIEFMDDPGATDVLSFPMDELRAPAPGESATAGMLGDVVLCPEFAEPQAAAAGHSLAAELDLLLVHGILHLLGHDHAEPEEHALMFGLQGELLQQLASSRGAQS